MVIIAVVGLFSFNNLLLSFIKWRLVPMGTNRFANPAPKLRRGCVEAS